MQSSIQLNDINTIFECSLQKGTSVKQRRGIPT